MLTRIMLVMIVIAEMLASGQSRQAKSHDSKNYCREFRLPTDWKPLLRTDGSGEIRSNDYEFRADPTSSSRFLMAGIEDNTSLFSPNKYSVDFSSPRAPIRSIADSERYSCDYSRQQTPCISITSGEWSRAPIVARQTDRDTRIHAIPFQAGPPYQALGSEVAWEGKTFRKSGRYWAEPSEVDGDVISPARDHIVLQSATGTFPSEIGMPRGTMFFDFFETTSGEHLFTLSRKYNSVLADPDTAFGKSRWVSDRYFFVVSPDPRNTRDFVVCDLMP
jgi:hypothetical protein